MATKTDDDDAHQIVSPEGVMTGDSKKRSTRRRGRRRRQRAEKSAAGMTARLLLSLLMITLMPIPYVPFAVEADEQLWCVTSDDDGDERVDCQFSVPKQSRSKQKMKFCLSEDDEYDPEDVEGGHDFCVEASVNGMVLVESEESTAKEKAKDADSSTKATSPSTTTTPPIVTTDDEQYRLVKGEPNGTIVVGKYVYETPYRQYGEKVATALREHTDNQSLVEEAMWLYLLGVAHQTSSTFAEISEDPADSNEDEDEFTKYHVDEKEVLKSLNAFMMAAQTFEGVRDRKEPKAAYAAYQLGSIYYQVSETYALSQERELWGTKKLDYDYALIALEKYNVALKENDSSMSAEDRTSALEGKATCSVRLGLMIVDDETEVFAAEEVDVELLHGVDIDKLMKDPKRAERTLGKKMKRYLSRLAKADEFFDEAIRAFDELAAASADNPNEANRLKYEKAMVYQNKVTVSTLREQNEIAIQHGEKAIELYKDSLKKAKKGSEEFDSIPVEIATLFYTISESYLQMGMYDRAFMYFAESMSFHEKYDLHPFEFEDVQGVWNGQDEPEDYEQALEEYHTSVKGALDSVVYPDDDALAEKVWSSDAFYSSEKDDRYEGDLHSNLGSMYLYYGDHDAAEPHLVEAVRLYESIDDEERNEILADAKYNLAMLKVRKSEFQESVKLYREAIQLYRSTVEEGINPIKREKPAMFEALKETTKKVTGEELVLKGVIDGVSEKNDANKKKKKGLFDYIKGFVVVGGDNKANETIADTDEL